MNIIDVLLLKFPDKSPIIDYQVFDKRDGTFEISYWNVASMGMEMPTLAQIVRWSDEVELSYIQERMRAERRKLYPPLPDQLDMIYHDKKEGTNKWMELIEEIKTSLPIPKE